MLAHISLFAGIGGIDLAAEWAGFETILMVENNAYCQKVLKKHWPSVPLIGDIKDVTREKVMENTRCRNTQQCSQSNQESDERHGTERPASEISRPSSKSSTDELKGTNLPPVTLITGGFPCQPVSQAGKRRGKADDRWLWPEMLRVISEVRPTWCVAENVAGLLNMGFNDCVSDLEGKGYEVQSFLIPACGVNAPHRRDRIFIVAHTGGGGFSESELGSEQSGRTEVICSSKNRSSNEWAGRQDVTDSERSGLEGTNSEGDSRTGGCSSEYGQRGRQADWWAVEPDVGRVASGIPSRVDRLKALGNAVVPQQIYPILKAIADIELGAMKRSL